MDLKIDPHSKDLIIQLSLNTENQTLRLLNIIFNIIFYICYLII